MNNLIYTKYSTNRKPEFNVTTSIYQNEQGKTVEKRPATPLAEKHINNIFDKYQELNTACLNKSIKFNKCKKVGNKIELEYVEGKLLSEELDGLLESDSYSAFVDKIKEYYQLISSMFKTTDFVVTQSFIDIFGRVSFNSKMLSTVITDIDCTFDNMIINNDITVIDYEWTFDFPIPLPFILYRSLKVYKMKENRKDINIEEICKLFGITKFEIEEFDRMEVAFQNYVTTENSINKAPVSLQELLAYRKADINNANIQVFYDYGQGYSEETSIRVPAIKNKKGYYKMQIPVQGSKSIRIDPIEDSCSVTIKSAIYTNPENHAVAMYRHNGTDIGGMIIFLTTDPQIIFEPDDLKTIFIEVTFKMEVLTEISWKLLQYYKNKLSNSRQQLEEKTKELVELKKEVELSQQEHSEIVNRLQQQLENSEKKYEIQSTNQNLLLEKLEKSTQELLTLQQELLQRENELGSIKNSRSWKLINKIKGNGGIK